MVTKRKSPVKIGGIQIAPSVKAALRHEILILGNALIWMVKL